MSLQKKAQHIVNKVQDRLSINLVSYQNDELAWLKDQLESLLDTEVEIEELTDPDELDDIDAFDGLNHEDDYEQDGIEG